MSIISWRRFGAQVPRTHSRLLDPVYATKAVNAKLTNGKLRAFKRPRFEFQTVNPGPIRSIYKYRGGGKEAWLHWSADVDVVKAPLAGDDWGRIYLTGLGRPKFADSTTIVDLSATLAVGASAGVNQLTVAANRGFAIGDPCVINYGGGVTQQVTLTNVEASAGNLELTFTPVTTSTLTTANSVTNKSHRYPLATYDLGVPAPTAALTLQVMTGGTEGTEGVQQGDIVSVSDIVVADLTNADSDTIGRIQSGGADFCLAAHNPYQDFAGVVANGDPMVLEAEARVALPINHHNETRDVGFRIHRSPTSGPILVGDDTNHVVRPAGSGYMDWEYTITAKGIDVPQSGTYTYRIEFSPVPGLAGNDNDSYTVWIYWRLKIKYSTRVKLTLASGHGLAVGDLIELSLSPTPDTGPDKSLDGKTVKVLAVSGNDITIEGVYGGKYGPGGTWKRSYAVGQTEDRAYAWTYVVTINGQDFESPPSPASRIVTVAQAGTVRLTGFVNPTTPTLLWDTKFSAIRLYRLSAGEDKEAQYLYRTDLALDVTQFDDSALGETLGEVLPTTGWELPPEDLQGMIELPEGGAAAFTKKEFCMAQPYYLHAWPASHRRTTHHEIVAIGAFGTSIGIVTKGTPYVVTGIDPATVSMERIEVIQPCVSKEGTVDLGYGLAYPTPDGLGFLAIGRADIVTKGVFEPEEWQALNPASFIAANYSGRYLAFYDTTTMDAADKARLSDVDFEFPEKGGFIFDMEQKSVVFLDEIAATAIWSDYQTRQVYLALQDGTIREFDADALEMEYRWKGKEYVLSARESMGWALVQAKTYPVRLTVFADQEPIYTRDVTDDQPFRLPDGEYLRWTVELQGQHQVEAVVLAGTADELAELTGGQ